MRTRKPCSPDTLFICRIQLAIADIFHDSAGKEHRILQNNAKRTAQIRFFYLVDINSVITDFAVRDIIKPVDQVCDRRLSGAGRAYKRHLLSGLCVQTDIMQDDFIRIVTKIHFLQAHVARQTRIGHAAVRAVRMLPCPDICTLAAFDQFTIFFFCIDQGYIAIVCLRLFIQQAENTICPRKTHDN